MSKIVCLIFLLTFQASCCLGSIGQEIEQNENLNPHPKGEFLEHLAYKFGTDKSRDDHKYTDFYSSIFNHRRHFIKNVTEIGVSMGQSLQVWHEYFPNAQIHGVDLYTFDSIKKNLSPLKRVHLHECDATISDQTAKLPFLIESMDLIVDDGPHDRASQEVILKNFWKFLKPGGYYIMEDVDAQKGGLDFEERPELLETFTSTILTENIAYFVDTSIGHRNWDFFKSKLGKDWARDHRIHNSYLLTIRKRIGHTPPVVTHSGSVSMHVDKIVKTN